jgi:hypothetical protein
MDRDTNGFGNGNGLDRDDFRRGPGRMRRSRGRKARSRRAYKRSRRR